MVASQAVGQPSATRVATQFLARTVKDASRHLGGSIMTPEDEEWLAIFQVKGRPSTVNMEELESVLGKIPQFGLERGHFFIPLSVAEMGGNLYDLGKRLFKHWEKARHKISSPRASQGNTWQIDYFFEPLREAKERLPKLTVDWTKHVTVVTGTPSGIPEHMHVYSSTPTLSPGGYDGHTKVEADLWLGMEGWHLTTPKGRTGLPTPMVGKGRKAKPEDPKAIQNRAFLKQLFGALYGAGLYKVVKMMLEGKDVEVVVTDGVTRVTPRRQSSPQIEKALREITDRQYQDVLKSWKTRFENEAKNYKVALKETPEMSPGHYFRHVKGQTRVSPNEPLFKMVEVKRDKSTGYHDHYFLKANWKKIAKERAVEAADAGREGFIDKNSWKLGRIVNKKGKFGKAEVIRLGTGSIYDGDIKFMFTDGSHFVVRNKSVLVRNPQGTVFYQYPTTFHQVVLPNGEQMREPSEQRMQDVFAAT